MKKKILIYIEDDLYIRNYFTYNSFDLPEYDVVIYASEQVTQRSIFLFLKNFKGYLHENKKRSRIRNLQFSVKMYKSIQLSQSFRFRYNRFKPNIISRFILKMTCLPIISDLFNYYIKIILKENNEVRDILTKEKPNLVIVPSQVVGSISLDFIEICQSLGIKTLFLIDGWDNISSKTVFPVLPDYLAVWGEQSVDHAVKMQNFPREHVFKIGTPRFESYLSKQYPEAKPYNFKYILFTGCAIPFDEITVLKILDLCLTKNKINDITIIYRPHPWRQTRKCFDFFIEADFKHTIMDRQMKEYYYCNKISGLSNSVQPALEYYPHLLKNCLFVISPLTTMIIESAIVGKKVLTLAYDDHYHFTSPLNAYKSYEHFKGIDKITAFDLCFDIKDVPDKFVKLLNEVTQSKGDKDYSTEIKYVIELTNESYQSKLNNIVNNILIKDGSL